MYVMSRNEAKRSADVVSGTFSINFVLVKTLFDSETTYSFVSSSILKSLGLVECEEIDLPISTPIGEIIRCTQLFKKLPLKIRDYAFPYDLIEFNSGDVDVIHRMNWLSRYKANIDCEV